MRINLDFGHTLSGADTGAEGCGYKEQDCTREIGYKVKAKLEALGHSINVCSVDYATSINSSLNIRAAKANGFGGDYFISIHLNAGGGHGVEVYTYQGKDDPTARNILNNIAALGYTNRGLKGASYSVLKNTTMKACLIECCFIDSKEDMNRYNAEAIANAIVKGLTGNKVVNTTPHTYINNDILQLQRELNVQGFKDKNGNTLIEDGIAGKLTISACPLVKKGAAGNITRWIQRHVNTQDDGIFGEGTRQAVSIYQASKGLEADGIVGKNTWTKLLGL